MENTTSSDSKQQLQQSGIPTLEADCSLEIGEEHKILGQKRKREDGEEATDLPIIVDAKKVKNEDVVQIDRHSGISDFPSMPSTRPVDSPMQQSEQSDIPSDKSSIVLPLESPFVNQMPSNEDLPVRENSSLILSSPISAAYAVWGETNALCRGSDRLNTVDNIQKANNDNDSELIEKPSWGNLPSISDDFINGLCSHLYNAEDGTDMVNLSMVSTPYNNGVHMFMKHNRPAIKSVFLTKSNTGGLLVSMDLIPSNLPFYGLSTLDLGRFERKGSSFRPKLDVFLNGPEDKVIDQISSLLSAPITNIYVDGYVDAQLSPADLSLCAHLLRDATIGYINIEIEQLMDTTASSIIEITSHSKELDLIFSEDHLHLSDSSAFITKLASMELTRVCMCTGNPTSTLLGLSNSSWSNILNQKFADGSFARVKIHGNDIDEEYIVLKFTKAPVNIPDDINIEYLDWIKPEAK